MLALAIARLLIASAWIGAAQAPPPTPAPAPSTGDSLLPPERSPIFDFHSGFWLNLHHFLYQQAKGASAFRTPPGKPQAPAPAPPSDLTAEEARSWSSSVDHYRKSLIDRDLLFDSGMVDIKNRLAAAESAPDLEAAGLPQDLVESLERAAPIYRKKLWAEHDRANRSWVEALKPLLDRWGARLRDEISTAYRTPWPTDRIRTDVTVYAGWAGAYTSDRPLDVTIGSMDPRNQGGTSLEILFHEASHGLVRHLQQDIANEFLAQGKTPPRDLWHAVLFFSTGELVRRHLGDYQPYAYRFGLYGKGNWKDYLPALEQHWKPYLDGKTSYEQAISALVGALEISTPNGR